MKPDVRIAVVGAGAIAQVAHLPVLAKMRGARLVALCDNDRAKARALADRLEIPDVFVDIEDLFGYGEIDAVVLATPSHLHEPHVLEAIAAGVDVLCERPLSLQTRGVERGVTVRNQAVLQRGVNDDVDVMKLLVKRLSYLNVHPYYVYMHDLVKGVEDLRTTLQTALDLEKHVRGYTAGFNTPTFVCDAPGGGGKRDVHSYEHYDRVTGISVYTAPSVKPGRFNNVRAP